MRAAITTKKLFLSFCMIAILIIIFSYIKIIPEYEIPKYKNNSCIKNWSNEQFVFGKPTAKAIKIAVSCCGENVMEQTLVMMKSALVTTKTAIHFIIFADDIKRLLNEKILEWPENTLKQISFEIINASFPNVKEPEKWGKAFKPCAAQRLFYQLLLPHHELVLHIDSDIVFLSPVDKLWNYFKQMNNLQLAAMGTNNMNPKTNWYLNHAKAPFVPKFGVNSGVMLMNLGRMREVNLFSELEPIVERYHDLLPWFDQDVFNVYFNYYPDKLLILPCKWNFISDHCVSGPLCESAQSDGVALLHGIRSVFHQSIFHLTLAFRLIYTSFRDYELETDLEQNLLIPMKRYLKLTVWTNCGANYEIFTKNLEERAARLKIINN